MAFIPRLPVVGFQLGRRSEVLNWLRCKSIFPKTLKHSVGSHLTTGRQPHATANPLEADEVDELNHSLEWSLLSSKQTNLTDSIPCACWNRCTLGWWAFPGLHYHMKTSEIFLRHLCFFMNVSWLGTGIQWEHRSKNIPVIQIWTPSCSFSPSHDLFWALSSIGALLIPDDCLVSWAAEIGKRLRVFLLVTKGCI